MKTDFSNIRERSVFQEIQSWPLVLWTKALRLIIFTNLIYLRNIVYKGFTLPITQTLDLDEHIK